MMYQARVVEQRFWVSAMLYLERDLSRHNIQSVKDPHANELDYMS